MTPTETPADWCASTWYTQLSSRRHTTNVMRQSYLALFGPDQERERARYSSSDDRNSTLDSEILIDCHRLRKKYYAALV